MNSSENRASDRRHARTLRTRDTGWGWAFAYFIPYCGLYHLITRKTLTPVFTSVVGIAAASLLATGYYNVVKGEDGNEKGRDLVASLAILVTLPGALKAGIEWDRVRAVKELAGDEK